MEISIVKTAATYDVVVNGHAKDSRACAAVSYSIQSLKGYLKYEAHIPLTEISNPGYEHFTIQNNVYLINKFEKLLDYFEFSLRALTATYSDIKLLVRYE